MTPPTDGGGQESPAAPDGGPPDAGPAPCRPVVHQVATLKVNVPLACGAASPAQVFDVAATAHGRAVALARLTISYPGSGAVHFWNAYVTVGKAIFGYGIGDDLCPGVSAQRANLGYGELSATQDRVRVQAYQGSTTCSSGALMIVAGSTLDVWIEDERPECLGTGVAVGSYYGANGFSTAWDWKTSMAAVPGAQASISTTAATTQLRVIGVVEGTPHTNPNTTCGAEAATLVMQTTLDGSIMATVTKVVPASQGMGHLVLHTAGDGQELRQVGPGQHQAQLLAGSNFTGWVTTGGCCGDGSIALIREP